MHSWGGLHYGNNSSNKKTSFRVYIALPYFFFEPFFFFVWSFSSVHSRSSCWPNTILLRFWQRGALIGVELARDDRRGGDSGG